MRANTRRYFSAIRSRIASIGNVLVLSGVLTALSIPAASATSLVNGGFEAASISPWTATGGINASVFGTGNATEGSNVALIGFNTTFGAASGSLSQTFNLLSAGTVDYAFRAGWGEPFCGCTDFGLSLTARIDSNVLTNALPPFGGSSVFIPLAGNYAGSLFLAAGLHTFVFEFERSATSFGRAPFFQVDGVSVTAAADVGETPLPAALPLFAGGLGVLGLIARRRQKHAATV